MTLLTEIAVALGSNHESIERDFGCYVVGDLCRMSPAPRTILLLESPHVDEVPAGHPLAGQSGKDVTEALKRNRSIETTLGQIESTNQDSSDNEAIGCILQRCSGTLRLGLMNACRLPLQITAYCPRRQAIRPVAFREADRWYHWQRHSGFLCFLQTVRDNPKLLSVEAEHHAFRVYRVLLSDLKSRLDGLPADARVVPCGKVARAFVAGAISLEGYQDVAKIWGYRGGAQIWDPDRKVPHPSRGHWRDHETNSNAQVVTCLLNMIHVRSGVRA